MKRKHAYTLMELIVVMAIISILSGLILAAVMKVRESGRRVSCANNLRQFGVAFKMYCQDWGSFPIVNNGHRLFYTLGYIENEESYLCSSDPFRTKGDPTGVDHDSYYSRLNPTFAGMDAGEQTIMAVYYPSPPAPTAGDDGIDDADNAPFSPFHDIDSKRVLMYDNPKAGEAEMHGNGKNYLFVDGIVTFWPFAKGWPDHDKLR
ncbi:MAG: type II secretion system protein [Candidatus Aureabacteria bacterium]|nr:type II secretion system protein [Candidatus Auribacterota bacterium]